MGNKFFDKDAFLSLAGISLGAVLGVYFTFGPLKDGVEYTLMKEQSRFYELAVQPELPDSVRYDFLNKAAVYGEAVDHVDTLSFKDVIETLREKKREERNEERRQLGVF